MNSYDHRKIESKWQKRWEESSLYKATGDSSKEKFYVLDMFPYPSGEGLHVGHVEGYTATDIYSRYKRMKGFNVLHPMGWDAFGLPAENYAIKTRVHPKETTAKAIANFKTQIKSLGLSYDWTRELGTHLPDYYTWTQWLFLLFYKNGLAYKKLAQVNWCEACKTVLANEQVIDGRCERCGNEVIQKDLEQWFFKITKYAEELIEGLNAVDWPSSTALNQRNWIGKSEGAEIDFPIKNSKEKITVFTTRPDTLFGATYMVLAPEHEFIQKLKGKIENWDEILRYIAVSRKKTELERTTEVKDKTGVELQGVKAVNPANNEEIPIFIADYVLATYGTGAIMAVPAHDERDFEFAKKYGVEIRSVVAQKPVTHAGAFLESKQRPGTFLFQQRGISAPTNPGGLGLFGGAIERGESLRDAVLRELREELEFDPADTHVAGSYTFNTNEADRHVWALHIRDVDENSLKIHEGEAIIPLTLEEAAAHPKVNPRVKEAIELHLLGNKPFVAEGILIESGQFSGARSADAKVSIASAVGGRMKTSYKLRDWLISRQRYWGAPIPIIYCDSCGAVPVPEKDLPVLLPEDVDFMPTGQSPLVKSKTFHNVFCPSCGGRARRESDTMDTFVCSSWYFFRFADPHNDREFASKEALKQWLPVDLYVGGAEHTVLHLMYARFFTKVLADLGLIPFREPFLKLRHQGLIHAEDGRKMSKSFGNVVNPDAVVERLGADTLRLHEMFLGPLEDGKPWSSGSIAGVRRLLEKVWRQKEKAGKGKTEEKLERMIHKTLKKVGEDIEDLRFNTAISQLMICVNAMDRTDALSREDFEIFLKTLAPLAPHIAEEIWENLGHKNSIHSEPWPHFREELVKETEWTIAVQVNGRSRDTLSTPAETVEEEIKERALGLSGVQRHMEGKKPARFIYVKGRLLNIVTADFDE